MLIHNARLWDGTGAPTRPSMTLRTAQGRVTWVGPDSQAPAPEADEARLDAGARWLLLVVKDGQVAIDRRPDR